MLSLLLSLVIITILMWLISPVFARMRGNIDAIKSVNRIRSLQLANEQYAAEHNGWYVAYSDLTGRDPENPNTAWYTNLRFRNYLGFYGKLSSNGSASSLLWPAHLLSPKTPSIKDGIGFMSRSYGYNGDAFEGTKTKQIYRLKPVHIFRPGQTLAFAEALNWWVTMATADEYWDGLETGPKGVAYRLGGKAAVVYFDGHAELLPREKVVGNTRLWMNKP